MSYCRMNDYSDVYLYRSFENDFHCSECLLSRGGNTVLKNRKDTVEHLRKHKLKGHKVPEDAIARLLFEIEDTQR